MKIKSQKKAAMEMSVGTIVTIVLLMTVLILGLILVRNIFSGAVENIDGINQAIKSEINKLFAENNDRKIVVYPPTRKIIIQKGEDNLGFGFSIRNVQEEADKFSYVVNAVEASCSITLNEAEDFISLGKELSNIDIPAGSIMNDPIFVRFNIPDAAPPCQIRYEVLLMHKGNTIYNPSVYVDLKIKSN